MLRSQEVDWAPVWSRDWSGSARRRVAGHVADCIASRGMFFGRRRSIAVLAIIV